MFSGFQPVGDDFCLFNFSGFKIACDQVVENLISDFRFLRPPELFSICARGRSGQPLEDSAQTLSVSVSALVGDAVDGLVRVAEQPLDVLHLRPANFLEQGMP